MLYVLNNKNKNMNTIEKMNIGIVGVCGRGASFAAMLEAMPSVRLHAICDLNSEALANSANIYRDCEVYEQYEDMLNSSELDAVIIGTPMHLHVSQSIAALECGLHVLSEVTAGVSIDECHKLVLAAAASKGIYMLAENYIYMRQNIIVREMVRRSLFGNTYYAEAEYLHDVKDYTVKTPWRRKWQMGIDGITYGTHSLGPVLQWMPEDRIVRVCCEGTGKHHADTRGEPFCQTSSTMLGKTEKGALIKIRVDLLSDRPHAMTNYQLQGTDGVYESARAYGEKDRIWLRKRSDNTQHWGHLEDMTDEFLPERWKTHMELANATGHGGSDYFVLLDFIDAIKGKHACPIGIHEAMDMTLPGLCSQESIKQLGIWVDVPNSRDWITTTKEDNPNTLQ
jgi:predicted dehydrogenase